MELKNPKTIASVLKHILRTCPHPIINFEYIIKNSSIFRDTFR